jgi:hypothetical protein
MAWRAFARGRALLVVTLFAAALAALLWHWRMHPPTPGLSGTSAYGRNIPGDLERELKILAVEFFFALAALQPWARSPRRRWIGLAGVALGAWAVLRFLSGLHAPPIAFPHDVLLLVLGIVMPFMALALPPRDSGGTSVERAT